MVKLTPRQLEIIEIVKQNQPISGEKIAEQLGLSRATLRSDYSILTMTGILEARPKVGYIYSGETIEPLLFDELFDVPVRDIMIPPLLIKADRSVYDAITTLFLYDVGSLYVINEQEELTGILSRKDLLRASLSDALDKTPVAVIMTRMPNIRTVSPEATLLEAGSLLMDAKVDSLPVVTEGAPLKVIGKITKTRIMEHLIEMGRDLKNENL